MLVNSDVYDSNEAPNRNSDLTTLIMMHAVRDPATVVMHPCNRSCLGRTCGTIRHLPAGVAPMHCSSLRYLGCDCSGCCSGDTALHEHFHPGNGSRPTQFVLPPVTSPPCKPMGGDFTRRCLDECKTKFNETLCPFCACASCAFCKKEGDGARNIRPALSTRMAPPSIASSPDLPMPPDKALVARVNTVWQDGKPSNNWVDAGVMVRMLDALPLDSLRPWEACRPGTWCAKYSAIWPSSLINRRHNPILYLGKQT